jgi:hypothetical protein
VEIRTLSAALGLQKVIPAHINEAVVAIWHSMPTDTLFVPEKKSALIMRSLLKNKAGDTLDRNNGKTEKLS